MNFQMLSPTSLAIAAGLTIPPLIALYFLKLKRQNFAISSTLLWRKAIEDLHVNSPFQRLRSSLLLFLQLLILALAAFALGQPMFARERSHEDTLILLIDQSASMNVEEDGNETRLEIAKREAERVVDSMGEDSRVMVIAYCDRATMVSSFDTDREALKRKIDTIEPTDSTTTLAEAISLAEAYSQNLIIGGATAGSDVPPDSAAAPASVLVFTDGRIEDVASVSPQRLDLSHMEIVRVGKRTDNVGIVAMEARRNYERPEALQVFATVRNFAETPMEFDATLFINDEHVDVQTVSLSPGFETTARTKVADADRQPGDADQAGDVGQGDDAGEPVDADQAVEAKRASVDMLDRPAPLGSVASVAFDEIEFTDAGVVEVRLSVRDALKADNSAWNVIGRPRTVDVLLVTEGNHLLEKLLSHLNVESTRMTPSEYESMPEEALMDVGRSRYDVVVFDRHSTSRLPPGNYMFWGSVPEVDGVSIVGRTEAEIFVDWKENHPVLRHTNIGTVNVFAWEKIRVPDDAMILIEGESEDSNVLSYWSRGGRQFLVCAFPIFLVDDESSSPILNTDWVLRWDFVTFMYDSIQFLSSNIHTGTVASLRPGEPRTTTVRARADDITMIRPDGIRETIPTGGAQSVVYARTRRVGVYRVTPASDNESRFAVNLLSSNESCVSPVNTIEIGSSPVSLTKGESLVNEPLWPWVVLVLLAILTLEWVVYNARVFV
jgi:VWA domain-containing protein/aerotolerance regulator-like protein